MTFEDSYQHHRKHVGDMQFNTDFWKDYKDTPPPPWYASENTPKRSTTMPIDEEVLAFFKATGRGYLQRVNNVLRCYVEYCRQTWPEETEKLIKQGKKL